MERQKTINKIRVVQIRQRAGPGVDGEFATVARGVLIAETPCLRRVQAAKSLQAGPAPSLPWRFSGVLPRKSPRMALKWQPSKWSKTAVAKADRVGRRPVSTGVVVGLTLAACVILAAVHLLGQDQGQQPVQDQ